MNDHGKSKLSVAPRASSRGLVRRAVAAALCALAPMLPGCGGGVTLPKVAADPYRGPAISVDNSGRQHIIIVEAPTPGWEITLDRSGEARDHREAYITLITPNPTFNYSQVVVRQQVLTPIDTRYPIRVYARALPFTSEAPEGEYHFAVAAEARATPLAPEPEPPRKPAPKK